MPVCLMASPAVPAPNIYHIVHGSDTDIVVDLAKGYTKFRDTPSNTVKPSDYH